MLQLLLFVSAFLFASCSSTQPEITHGKENRPHWIMDAAEFCGSEKLCAVGEGLDLTRAETHARSNLAKIFKVEINSTTEVSEETKSTSSANDLESSGVSEEVRIHTSEAVDEVLEGVTTSKKHQEDDGSFFVLAELDKTTVRRLIKPRIEALDIEIEQAFETGRRSLLPTMLDLDAKREGLKDFLKILGVPAFPSSVTREQLIQLKNEFAAKPIRVLVADQGKWDAVAQTVRSELTALGYKIVSKGAHDFKVVVENDARREYLNVRGFERYFVSIQLKSMTKDGEVVGGLAFEEAANGRSLSQIRSMLLEKFRTRFYFDFPGLHLD